MAGARADAAAAGSWAAPGGALSRESGLGELLQEFSRTQYRAKDGGGTGGSKVGPRARAASPRARSGPGMHGEAGGAGGPIGSRFGSGPE